MPQAPRSGAGTKVAVVVIAVVLVLGLVGAAVAWYLLAGPAQTGACVEEWQYQSPTRKEGYTRAECESFCASGVNSNHLACYFEPY